MGSFAKPPDDFVAQNYDPEVFLELLHHAVNKLAIVDFNGYFH